MNELEYIVTTACLVLLAALNVAIMGAVLYGFYLTT